VRTTKYEISVLASGRGSVARVASKASDRDGATTAADKPSKAPAWQMNYARIKRGKHHVDLMWILPFGLNGFSFLQNLMDSLDSLDS